MEESTSKEGPEQRDPRSQAIHMPPLPQPTVVSAMSDLQPQRTYTLGLAAPAFSGAMQQSPASYMPMPTGNLWPLTLPIQATQVFYGVIHPYSAPHSATWPRYAPLVATLLPFHEPQGLQTCIPSMAYLSLHPSRNTTGVTTPTSLSATGVVQQVPTPNIQTPTHPILQIHH